MIKNYYVCNADKEVIIPEEGMMNYCLAGEVYGQEGFKNGSRIRTSTIVNVKDSVAITSSGSAYELGSMHPDYAEILSAMEEGIPVIKDWSLKGNLRDGYVITGHVGDDTVTGKVSSQEGNFITLDDNKDYLVIWKNLHMDPMDGFDMLFSGQYCDLRVDRDFSENMFELIRPNLMA